MNINTNIYNSQNSQYKKQQSFGSAGEAVSQTLRYLSVNEAVGATLVDFFSMALPRTIVDSTRGLDAGIETGIRENSGTANHVMIGTIGGLAAFALSPRFNKTYDVFAHAIFANNETIDILGSIWNENYLKSQNGVANKTQNDFYRTAFERMSGLVSSDGNSEKWISLQPKTIDILTKNFVELANDESLKGKRIPKEKLNFFRNIIISDTGAERTFQLQSKNGAQSVEFALNSFLDDLLAMGRAFSTEKVTQAFKDSAGDLKANKFLNELKSLKMRSAGLGLAISCAIGASVQPFNRWLTKKRTGNDGFVGVSNNPNAENKKADVSSKFIIAKGLAASSILALALGSISTNLKEIPNKIQFKGKFPTMNHFKLVYGVTIASRFLAARSGDELREACFKDFLGFTNWLILGGFVSKGVATMLDGKNLLNAKGDGTKEGLFNWLKNKSVKTVDEILQKDLELKGVQTATCDGKALTYKKMLSEAKRLNMNTTLKKIKYLNIAQASGYIYSGVVLGWLIPKLNIKMTEYSNRKKEMPVVNGTVSPSECHVDCNGIMLIPQAGGKERTPLQALKHSLRDTAFADFIE